jgi:hypothetical protein
VKIDRIKKDSINSNIVETNHNNHGGVFINAKESINSVKLRKKFIEWHL